MNIAVDNFLAELKNHPYQPVIESSDGLGDITTEQATYLEAYACALKKDPIGMVRKIVAACRSSGTRRSDLKDIIEAGNKAGSWGLDEEGEVNLVLRVLQLLRDCETRWSSIFLMIMRLIYLYPVRFRISL